MPGPQRQPDHPATRSQYPAPEVVARIRAAAIRECVTWLARHNMEYQPHALAGEMADDLLPEVTEQ